MKKRGLQAGARITGRSAGCKQVREITGHGGGCMKKARVAGWLIGRGKAQKLHETAARNGVAEKSVEVA